MNKKEVKELLNSLGEQLKAEVDTVRADLKEARTVATKLNNLLIKSEELISKLEDSENGIDAKLAKASSSSIKIDEATGTAQATLTTILQNLTTVQENITAMQAAYVEFQTLKTKIDDPTNGLAATLSESQEIRTDIEAVKTESETVYKEISRYKESAAKNGANIEAIKIDSQAALDIINTTREESESLRDKISKIFEIVSQSGHANYFDQRRKILTRASWWWLVAALLCVGVAVIIAILFILPLTSTNAHNNTVNLVQELAIRFSTVTPFLILSIWSANNYTRERRLAEHYAFRAVSALSIEGSLLLLNRSLVTLASDSKDTKIVDLAIATMQTIYTEPKEQNQSTRFHVRGGNKLVQVGAELNQTLENIDKNLTTAITRDQPNRPE